MVLGIRQFGGEEDFFPLHNTILESFFQSLTYRTLWSIHAGSINVPVTHLYFNVLNIFLTHDMIYKRIHAQIQYSGEGNYYNLKSSNRGFLDYILVLIESGSQSLVQPTVFSPPYWEDLFLLKSP